MSGLVFVHGLPGAGKTTLCRAMRERRDDILYVDMARSPDWGQVPAWEICAAEYGAEGDGRWLLIEGFAARKGPRDRFVSSVAEAMTETLGEPPEPVEIVLLRDPGSEVLAGRRKRSARDYESMRAGIETGSTSFRYTVFDCSAGEDVETLATRFDAMLDRWMGVA